MRRAVILVMIGLMIGGAAISAPAAELGRPMHWTGHNWIQVSQDAKIGYIFGMGNMADFEAAASKMRGTGVSQAPAKKLKSMTVLQIVQAVNSFYKNNPGKLDTPVIEVVLGAPGQPGGNTKGESRK
jgi:hypothetical protein